MHQAGAFFVTRAKHGMDAHRVYSSPAQRDSGVIRDQRVMLNGFYSAKAYPEHLRRVCFRMITGGKPSRATSVALVPISLDLPVSAANRHLRYGPSLLYRYMPFFVATYVERLIVLLVPLLVVIVPLVNLLPKALSERVRSRIYRLYGELKLLERDVVARTGTLRIARWLADLDRIKLAAARIKTPTSFASEADTLREHIGLVRRAVITKAQARPASE